jgi:hypothetical protein
MFTIKDRLPQDALASSGLGTLVAPPQISSNLGQKSKTRPFVFSRLRTLLPAQKFQRPYFQSLPHSLKYAQNITPVFPITSTLFLRSCACVQVSTSLLSIACALFRKTTGDRGIPEKRISPRVTALSGRPCRGEMAGVSWPSFQPKPISIARFLVGNPSDFLRRPHATALENR